MTQEEKAKAYDEALKVLHKYDGANIMFTQDLKEEMFPELKESEDENIKKKLISYFSAVKGFSTLEYNYGITNEEAVTWLEKQNSNVDNANKEYWRGYREGKQEILDKYAELEKAISDVGYIWDAEKKELKEIEKKSAENEELTEFDKAVGVSIGTWNPKTPEQIQSVKAVSKKLLKLAKKQINDEQKVAWSEEDERFLNVAINILNSSKVYTKSPDKYEDTIDWLKDLKDRVQPQNLTITDEELAQAKKDAYNDALDKIEYHSGEPTFDDGWSAAIWYLKKRNAQPRSQWKPSDRDIKLLRELSDGKICPDNYRTRLYEIINNLKFL